MKINYIFSTSTNRGRLISSADDIRIEHIEHKYQFFNIFKSIKSDYEVFAYCDHYHYSLLGRFMRVDRIIIRSLNDTQDRTRACTRPIFHVEAVSNAMIFHASVPFVSHKIILDYADPEFIDKLQGILCK